MKQLTLTKPWTYHSIEKTIDFNEAGTFEVTNEVHAAAVEAGVTPDEEKADGDGNAKASTPRRPAAAEK